MIFDPCFKYCFLFYFLIVGRTAKIDFDKECLKDNIDYGPDFAEIVDVDNVQECVKACKNNLGCAAFSFALEIGCSLYTKNRMVERSTSKEYHIESGILAECVHNLKRVPKNEQKNVKYGSDYQLNDFQPICAKHRDEPLSKQGGIMHPRPLGGFCFDQVDKHECGEECIPKDKPCNGSCSYDQCLGRGGRCRQLANTTGFMITPVRKSCDGKCLGMKKKCNGTCDWNQCETPEGECLNPEQDRTEAQKKLGLYEFKTCNGKCIPINDLCDNSCGDAVDFCWSSVDQKCLSTREKNKKGRFKRYSCYCDCIPYDQKCDGSCDSQRCEGLNGHCYFEMTMTRNNTRRWRKCNGLCIDYDSKCDLSSFG